MAEELVRIGPMDDWVRTVSAHLRTDAVPLATERRELDRWLDTGTPVLLSCGVAGLAAVLGRLIRREQVADTPIGWIPDADADSRALGRALGLPARPTLTADVAAARTDVGPPRPVRLVRDDHGGLLLWRGTLSAAQGRRFGAQTYHDDARIADGRVRRIEVRPDYTADCAVRAVVVAGWRGGATTVGRSVQTACDEARATSDGTPHPRPVTRWTWYADPRQHWLLRTPARPA